MAELLPLAGLHHLSFVSADVEKSIAFYCEVMGFRQLWRPAFAFAGAWLFGYGVQIHLIGDQPEELHPERDAKIWTTANHVAFQTTNLDVVEERLKELGIAYRRNVQTGTGTVQLFLHDPDGHHIEIGNYPPAREPL